MTARSVDRIVAGVLFVGYLSVLVSTAGSLGYARDEGFYFHAAEAYRRWFDLLLSEPSAAFVRENVD
ncbi:MAG TPA: hypothetical protein VIM73_19620, partial [Polyangiaceae bacterium]